MTKEEAAMILDPDSTGESLKVLSEGIDLQECVHEARRLAVAALRAQQTPPDRNRVEGCWKCERLTYNSGKKWEVKGADGIPCDEVCEGRGLGGCGNCPIQNVFDRLAAYEDTGLEPEEIMALIAPPNPPLTLEELREMGGEPVWITPGGFWALVIARIGERVRLINHEGEIVWADKEIELVGPVYRRKPEEGRT